MIINPNNGSRVAVHIPAPGTPSSLSVARRYLAAATDGAGNVIVAGGMAGTAGTVEEAPSAAVDRYDASGTRTTLTPLSVARAYVAAARDGSGSVIVLGGGTAVDRYDTSGTRTSLAALPQAVFKPVAATDGSGRAIFGGGDNGNDLNLSRRGEVYAYDASGTRTTLTPLSAARTDLAAATDGNKRVLFGGGSTASGTEGAFTSSAVVDCYDVSGTRTTLTALSQARAILAAVTCGKKVLFGGGLSVAGGFPPLSIEHAVVDCYDVSGTRTTLTALSQAREDLSAATDGSGRAYFAGGRTQGSGPSAAVDCYDESGTRTTITPLSSARSRMAAATGGAGQALFFGGETIGVPLNLVDSYAAPTKSIMVPAWNAYKFAEHAQEQPAHPTDTQITVAAPNVGYFRQISGATTL